MELHVDRQILLRERSAGLNRSEVEPPVGVVLGQDFDVARQVRAVEHRAVLQRQLSAQGLEIDGGVARHVDRTHAELRALADRNRYRETLWRGIHQRLTDLDLEIAVVGVGLLDRPEIPQEHRLGVGSRLVEPAGRPGPESPALGGELFLEFLVVEGFVALEGDGLEAELFVLQYLEVDSDRTLREALDLILHVGEVVALCPVQGLHPTDVFVKQRVVERRAGGERQRVTDLLAVDVLVALDRYLADYRILLDDEGEDASLLAVSSAHGHVAEEAELENGAHIRRDLGVARRLAHPRANARPDGV